MKAGLIMLAFTFALGATFSLYSINSIQGIIWAFLTGGFMVLMYGWPLILLYVAVRIVKLAWR